MAARPHQRVLAERLKVLFTSLVFFVAYLPTVFIGYYLLSRHAPIWAAGWLFAASVFFYGYWMPEFTTLLIASICWNYFVGTRIGRLEPDRLPANRTRAKRWLIAGILVNLFVLGYFKYAGFFVSNINALLGQHWSLGDVVLPIGISFFTFTQIAFLADAYQKGIREYRFIHFGLFVTYFPHLVAGPVLHHAQMMPQFKEAATYRLVPAHVAAGLSIFAIGLFKKVILADGISPYADAVFDGAFAGSQPDFSEAWIGALAYTFQLYFDFSGYSDMAIGLSWMFNVRLPFNFNSPYKALNISDFWRRWHMTLSAFLRDYLYIPLGGNRKGGIRRYVNLATTMVLGGLWHGASWTFVFWGALHGLYLVVNHAFQSVSGDILCRLRATLWFKLIAWLITFLSVVVAWVFFRAVDFSSALRILGAMTDMAVSPDISTILWNQGLDPFRGLVWLASLCIVAFVAPNSNRVGEALLQRCRSTMLVIPFILGAALIACTLLILINGMRDSISAFIYFNF